MAGRSALIIGASRGIGLGLAEHLAARGYKVYASQRSDSAELAAAAKAHPGKIEVVRADVTDEDGISALASRLVPSSLDLLIMNAGVYGGSGQDIPFLSRENVADIMMTNAVGPVKAALILLPLVKDRGRIGLMSSKMGSIEDSSGGVNLYRISKVSQNMLARSLFEKHARQRGISVLSLHPGWVQTEMGGPNALITVDDCVAGLIALLEAERQPEHRFLAYDGQEVPW